MKDYEKTTRGFLTRDTPHGHVEVSWKSDSFDNRTLNTLRVLRGSTDTDVFHGLHAVDLKELIESAQTAMEVAGDS